ncbi:selenium-binding protein SBP56-related protein [Natrialbaceae archaeon AArc-T1-2]|uniref:selenium-binding protein SBP56-related protein n=1 Tax=Natrialbaceae archaeon AArc-T1-2 TaxID=3053904 RepID=UPI00255A9C38|nr:selenium-binding protein SBP56-related protein [Natrialbaceae archaeon AArc-T1-2]WIV66951.1 selenium-binding protein SBP56-related protein [Natrialbaceae archaeon AArc-T1-2]
MSETHDHTGDHDHDHDHDHEHEHPDVGGPGYPTPAAMRTESGRERTAYVMAPRVGMETEGHDVVGVVDLDPDSETYSELVDVVEMPNRGDELHHFGWNACSSSCHVGDLARQYLVVPGQRSSRIHIIDVEDPRDPEMVRVIEPEEVFEYDLSAPHTVHCVPGGKIIISMLGNADGELPGGFLQLDQEDFSIDGRWEADRGEMAMNYDYWYQPRHNVLVSSEWAAPETYYPGFDLDDVEDGNYGDSLHIWDWESREHVQTLAFGEDGQIPLEVRMSHNPEETQGYVGAALSSNMIHFYEESEGTWDWDVVIDEEPREHPDWDMPVPPLITDIVLSLDDQYLFFSNWLHGDVRMYDVSDMGNPRLVDRIWAGGLFGDRQVVQGTEIRGAPQMLQLSRDGQRLYWTTSLFSSWDNQFYPEMAEEGSLMLKANVYPEEGRMELDEEFLVDFGEAPGGPARAHEIRWPGGDCTSDVWQ